MKFTGVRATPVNVQPEAACAAPTRDVWGR